MNNAPAHPTDLGDTLLEKFNFITLKFLLANTIHLANQWPESHFKSRNYAQKQCFKRYFEVTSSIKMTLREFLKKHINVFNSISLIDKTWKCTIFRLMNSVWKKLWPGCVYEKDLRVWIISWWAYIWVAVNCWFQEVYRYRGGRWGSEKVNRSSTMNNASWRTENLLPRSETDGRRGICFI